ncbi:esterase/lipase family protein [Marinobacter caseinilyticus]|uniref:esterase/lipase family protein n=1 Tax=Marinobacter caseinilyticus TaxID=2692195 RepID=UPI00140A2CF6|nr:alpha/beta fold hydrolase [Marinobacter caseinilyticus]
MFRTVFVTSLILAVSCWVLSAPSHAAKPGSEAASALNPILFVHGYASGASVWDSMRSRFEADGWPADYLASWSYNYNQSNASTAEDIRNRVQDLLALTGADQVDIITHSMGGLSSRYYLKFLEGDAQVDAWVSLAGPNHGTNWAFGCLSSSCFEMRPGSGFLANLNQGNETPGEARYGTWWSSCDEIINPDDSVLLKGASNNRTACISHNWFLYDSGVYREVRDWIL